MFLDGVFGTEMPFVVKFFLAFLLVLGLIGVGAWGLRRFTSGRLGGAGTRGRQPRLGVIDYASVDARRRLILVRRDNVEHLLMIGGPTDVVVEANIVRAVAAPRDVALARPAAAEPLPRAIPLPDNGNGSWPLQPEVITRRRRRVRRRRSNRQPTKRRRGRRCSHKPTHRRHGRNAILWRRWPTSFRRVRRHRPRRLVFARRLPRVRRSKRAPNRALSSRVPNRALPQCRRRQRRRPRTPRPPIKASPKWRIASKPRCANPTLRPKRARRNRAKKRKRNR